jgi:hypothetical protein
MIDARGADAAAVEQRVQRALMQVHGKAVQDATAVQKEINRRVPMSQAYGRRTS